MMMEERRDSLRQGNRRRTEVDFKVAIVFADKFSEPVDAAEQ